MEEVQESCDLGGILKKSSKNYPMKLRMRIIEDF